MWVDGGNFSATTSPKVVLLLKEHLPVIIGLNGPFFSPSGRGHIITLVAIEHDQITYADPATGTLRTTDPTTILLAPPHPDGKFLFYPQKR